MFEDRGDLNRGRRKNLRFRIFLNCVGLCIDVGSGQGDKPLPFCAYNEKAVGHLTDLTVLSAYDLSDSKKTHAGSVSHLVGFD